MNTKKRKPIPAVSSQYLRVSSDDFSAYSVVSRLKRISTNLKYILNNEITIECIESYYVQLAACIEIHSKSRYRDLLNYRPIFAFEEDIEIGPEYIKLSKQNISIAQFISANTKISCAETYKKYINKTFSIFDSEFDIYKFTNKNCKLDISMHDIISNIFDKRHKLAHEITGDSFLRINISSYEIEEIFKTTNKLIQFIACLENHLTNIALKNFPNLLDQSLTPLDIVPILQRSITSLEDDISALLDIIPGTIDSRKWKSDCRMYNRYFKSSINPSVNTRYDIGTGTQIYYGDSQFILLLTQREKYLGMVYSNLRSMVSGNKT